jgi:DNA-binding CsgD family transcriptional regulator
MTIEKLNRYIKISSILLVSTGILLLAADLYFGGQVNIALPLVFLMLGGAFYILAFIFLRRWPWAIWIFMPGSILIALGIIFLLNVLTGDWNAWAYAWLLIVAGIGLGLLLASRLGGLKEDFTLAGVGLIILGITFFVVFGMIAGGRVIRIAAPILLVLGGLSLRWLKPGMLLSGNIFRHSASGNLATGGITAAAGEGALVEPLTGRELEVLRLIDQGLSNPEIAAKLTLANSTVKTHINNIYGKLGVQTRVQALNRARELGLLS